MPAGICGRFLITAQYIHAVSREEYHGLSAIGDDGLLSAIPGRGSVAMWLRAPKAKVALLDK